MPDLETEMPNKLATRISSAHKNALGRILRHIQATQWPSTGASSPPSMSDAVRYAILDTDHRIRKGKP